MDMPGTVRAALQLEAFDTRSVRVAMSPLGGIPARPGDAPGKARVGAVLIVLYMHQGKLHTLLIRRRDDLTYHPGQIAFPGGRREHGETGLETALRETREEVGIAADGLKVAGALDPVYILVSDFCVHPFIAWHEGVPCCTRDPREVAGIIEAPLALLCAPEARAAAPHMIRGRMRSVPGFSLYGHHIWGATATMLHELLERLKAAGWRDSLFQAEL